jgi:hypothetical protein
MCDWLLERTALSSCPFNTDSNSSSMQLPQAGVSTQQHAAAKPSAAAGWWEVSHTCSSCLSLPGSCWRACRWLITSLPAVLVGRVAGIQVGTALLSLTI